MRGIIFAGCSFTWGQGLYYYSDLDNTNLSYKNSEFNMIDLRLAQIKYMESKRFPRLVANHFNTFEVVQKYNGGRDTLSIEFIDNTLGLKNKLDRDEYLFPLEFEPKDFNFIIFQTSQVLRNPYKLIFDNKEFVFESGIHHPSHKATFNIFCKYLKSIDLTFEEWYSDFIVSNIENIKQKLSLYEEAFNINTRLLCWTDEYLPYIKTDTFLSKRLIHLEYDNNVFKCIQNLIEFEPEFEIINNKKFFEENTPNDEHPSMECHKIIADSIIKNIENTKYKLI